MLISLKHSFVFICMPKCASRSIETMLRPHCEIQLGGTPPVRHTSFGAWATHIRPFLRDVAHVEDIETVSLFREPVSWLGSWYRFRARHALRGGDNERSTAGLSFEEFVEAYLSEPPPAYARIGSQYEFIADDTGQIGVDHLLRYEDMPAVLDFFSARVGRRLSMRSINVSPRRIYGSDVVERMDSLRRSVVGRLGRSDTGSGVVPAPGLELPERTLERLRARIPRDFETYAHLT